MADMRDEVDELVTAWERELPDLSVAPLHVLSRVSRVAQLLDGRRRAAFSANGLQAWEFDVLAALRRSGTPYELSPGALIYETLSTSGTMTNRIDRLAARGMVERLPDPNDRRGVRVRLTEAGRVAVEDALAALLAREHVLLGVLSSDEVDDTAALLRSLLTSFEGGH